MILFQQFRHLLLQILVMSAGFDLDIQMDLATADFQHFFQCRNPHSLIFFIKPAAIIQVFDFIPGHLPDFLIQSCRPFQIRIMHNDHFTVCCLLYIQFRPVSSHLNGSLECRNCILRIGCRIPAMRRHFHRIAQPHM